MIYRDDDLPQGISMETLNEIHQLFIRSGKIHTMSILASELEKSPGFVQYVNSHKNIDLVLHGWTHTNYSLEKDDVIREDLRNSLLAFDKYFSKYPTVWYLPWNGWVKGEGFTHVPRVKEIAVEFGLEVITDCTDIGRFLKGEKKEVIYFHHWNQKEVSALPQLLEIS